MESFCRTLPKIELHAHLNGSLSDSTLMKLLALKESHEDCSDIIKQFKIEKGHSRTLHECFELFNVAHSLTDTPEAVKLAVFDTLQEFNDDNVIYLELRSTPRETERMTKSQYVQSMIDSVVEKSKSIPMKTCLLISIDRRKSLQEAAENVNLAIQFHEKYPDIVVGLDLSGNPHVGNFKDFASIMDRARMMFNLKISVHAGELPAEDEVFQILSWRPDRLGHMTCNSEFTGGSKQLWNAIVHTKIPIELCLTSNVKSETVRSYATHHFKSLYAAGHPISLGTDDKGVFSTSLSEEFFICGKTFNLNSNQLWMLSYNAAKHTFADMRTKVNLLKTLCDFKVEHNL